MKVMNHINLVSDKKGITKILKLYPEGNNKK
jgi:hypothetical protein